MSGNLSAKTKGHSQTPVQRRKMVKTYQPTHLSAAKDKDSDRLILTDPFLTPENTERNREVQPELNPPESRKSTGRPPRTP